MAVQMMRERTLIHSHAGSNCHIETDLKNSSPLHGHDFYEIFIILSGECIHAVNGMDVRLAAGDMTLIRPGDVHEYKSADAGGKCSFLNVNFMNRLSSQAFLYFDNYEITAGLRSSALPPVVRLSREETEALVKKAGYINIYGSADAARAELSARAVLTDMLSHFYLSQGGTEKSAMPEWFKNLLVELQKECKFVNGTDELYELCDKTPGHINRLFKRYLNTTSTAYVNSLKLDYARLLIVTTDKPLIDIAYEAGFDNLSHFYHLFKREYNISPGAMRKQK